MSSSDFSARDVRFRRTGDDVCDIIVYGQTVGIVTRRPDIAAPDGGGWFYAVHLYDDRRGPDSSTTGAPSGRRSHAC